MVEDANERTSTSNSAWSMNWNKNAALATEVTTVLGLVDTVVNNMKGFNEGKIVMHTDCRKAWELLTEDRLKASEITGDGGSIISRIIELESKSKIRFEHEHVKTNNVEDKKIK